MLLVDDEPALTNLLKMALRYQWREIEVAALGPITLGRILD